MSTKGMIKREDGIGWTLILIEWCLDILKQGYVVLNQTHLFSLVIVVLDSL